MTPSCFSRHKNLMPDGVKESRDYLETHSLKMQENEKNISIYVFSVAKLFCPLSTRFGDIFGTEGWLSILAVQL